MCGGHTGRAKHIIPRSLHTLLEPNHVRRDLHDRGKQGERATPRSAQSHTVVHYLANEVLHTPTVVLHRLDVSRGTGSGPSIL